MLNIRLTAGLMLTAAAIAAAAGANAQVAPRATLGESVREALPPHLAMQLIPASELASMVLTDQEREILRAIAEPWALTAAMRQFDMAEPQIVASDVVMTPLSRENVLVFKVMDNAGKTEQMLFNTAGQVLQSDLLIAESDLALEARGKIHPELDEALRNNPPGKRLSVLIWCRTPEGIPMPQRPDPSQKLDEGEADALFGQLAAVADIANRVKVAPVAQTIQALGAMPVIAERAPMIYAELDAQAIAQVAAHPDVMEIYFDSVNEPEMNISRQVVRAHTVHNRGITGGNTRVAVVEVGGRVNTANPWLPSVVQNTVSSCLSDHTAWVVGAFASRHGVHRGIAPFGQMWIGGSCSANSSQLQSRINAARDWGARVINLSWGTNTYHRVPDANARFLDNLVVSSWRTVVKSAGNRGLEPVQFNANGQQINGPNVTNPGLFYNGITVGAYNDRNTVSTSDDVMSPTSSFLNPSSTHSDRQKPELVAPGTQIVTLTNASPWITLPGPSGTSLAAPIVSGAATLLMQRSPALQTWPEAVKAILMATAFHNIEGNARLSDRDGVGGIQADRADDVARGVNGGWGGLNYNCSRPVNTDVATISLRANRRARVVITWNTNTNYNAYAARPSADLDLQIIAPNGSVVASSSSWDNTFEIVDFTPSAAGNYRVRVRKFRCDLTPSYVGYAWYQMP